MEFVRHPLSVTGVDDVIANFAAMWKSPGRVSLRLLTPGGAQA
jgi:hypothetical protein